MSALKILTDVDYIILLLEEITVLYVGIADAEPRNELVLSSLDPDFSGQ